MGLRCRHRFSNLSHETAERTCVEVEKQQLDRSPRVTAAPKIRQVLWCDYPEPQHTYKPEFHKTRPVVVLSKRATLYGVVIVVPMTTKEQDDDRFSVELVSPLDGTTAWVVCNHVHTVSVRRLSPPKGAIPRVSDSEFEDILDKVFRILPIPTRNT